MDKHEREEGLVFSPKFDENGLIPCVAQDDASHDILMVAYMNRDALDKTLQTGEAHYWSRSRSEIWHKGATSGAVQKIERILTDCDQDCLILKVRITEATGSAATCHTGRRTCFYRSLSIHEDGSADLVFTDN